MVSFEKLNMLDDKLFNEGMNSQVDLDKLYKEDKLKSLIDNTGLYYILKQDITAYLDFLFIDHPYQYTKKIMIEQLTKGLHWNAYYLLALYCDNENAYRNLPLILELLIKKLNITKYKYITKEDLITRIYHTYDIKDGYDLNRKHYECEIIYKFKNDKYDKYDDIYNISGTHPNNSEEFSVWAEHLVYDEEHAILPYEIKNKVMWVAREYGDGYGFDVLSIDLDTNKEKLIEVKSGQYEGFSLTENEVKVMKNCKFKNAEYYIYKYTYNKNDNIITTDYYKYDADLDLLIDQNNEYYDLSPYDDYDDYNNKIIKYSITKYEKEKTLTK